MKQIWKNKKLRNIIIIALTIIASLWGYQEFVRHSIKKQIHELTHIEEQPVADYRLAILLGNKCVSEHGSNIEIYQSNPENIPILKLLWSALKSQGCKSFGRGTHKAPHMELKIKQKKLKETYKTPSGEFTRYMRYYWSFRQNKFVYFNYWYGVVGGDNASFYTERKSKGK